MDLPKYSELPIRPDLPAKSAWGVFGDADQIGTINLLTPERVVAAAQLIRRGAVFNLDLPLHLPNPRLTSTRHDYRHTIFSGRTGNSRDDYLDSFYLQASSQWDSLRHMRHPDHGFYNGTPDEAIHHGPGARLGIENWAERGIVGRAVLVDVARYQAAQGAPIDPSTRFAIDPALLDATLAHQKVTIQIGDILLLRTGWTDYWFARNDAERQAALASFQSPGLDPTEAILAWLWDHHVAAVGADCVAVEAWPPAPGDNFLHPVIIPLLGLAIGELWNLEGLAADSATDGVYESFFVSKPLHLRGGVGSPPNALAIK